ncbi:MAG TPA: tRNA (adenosine(37)-N6)-dimethylallyltransferase MiaA [Solirubrobacteraceae bacterium]|nr:tRNA (adenosine(37)-N6)-dimethylallyltransferase MiaA [Solirubrobacteraceae bacterium]
MIALFGPTGVGKTAIAIALAARMRELGERPVAVSADALQLYRGLELLTAAPTAAERDSLEHELVACFAVSERLSVARYARLAHERIDALLADGATPIVVGGTGLYLRAALSNLEFAPPPRPGVREHWLAALDASGPAALHALLAERAPASAVRIAPTDRQRIVRALELHDLGALRPPRAASQLWSGEMRHPTRLIGLVMEREALYARIDARVEEIVASGAAVEVEAALRAGASATARKALGFQEILDGDIDALKRRTRNYARRQLTWMRKLPDVELVDVTGRSPDEVAAALQ